MATTRPEVTGRATGAAASAEEKTPPSRFIDKKEVLRRVPWSYPTLWHKMRIGEFPRSRDLDGKSFWVEAEVEDWIKSRPIRPLKGDADPVPPHRLKMSQSRRRQAKSRVA